LLEVRTWHTISQTKDGHVGGIRDAFSNTDAAHKMLLRTGVAVISVDDDEELNEEIDRFQEHMLEEDDDINPDLIHAAMLRSQQSGTVTPMSTNKPSKRRQYFKKKKV